MHEAGIIRVEPLWPLSVQNDSIHSPYGAHQRIGNGHFGRDQILIGVGDIDAAKPTVLCLLKYLVKGEVHVFGDDPVIGDLQPRQLAGRAMQPRRLGPVDVVANQAKLDQF